jgi:hypothetical protein
MPDERPSTGLSSRGQLALQSLAVCLDVSDSALLRMFWMVDPPPDLPGLHVVIPRLARVLPWMALLAASGAARYAQYARWAEALCSADKKKCWEPEIPREAPARRDVTNILAGQIGRFPHYALYTELPGDRTGAQDERVAPLIALYTLLRPADLLSPSARKTASSAIRQLISLSSREGRQLRDQFPTMPLQLEAAWAMYRFVAGYAPLERVIAAATQVAKPPTRRALRWSGRFAQPSTVSPGWA